jgi:sugar transferase (PEP-CTERM/EpsH1 system associated)
VTLVSDNETALYRSFCAPGLVQTVTNGVDLDYFQPDHRQTVEQACVFVGALDYRPNSDAACWFCREVWPSVRQQLPEARLWLVGRRPPPEVQRLETVPGVRVIGQVPDVRPYVASAALAVVPLRIARGVQNKVLEALAMGKAVLSSPQGLAGLRNGQPLPVVTASAVSEWVEEVVRLLGNKALCRQLGQEGRYYVEEHHSWDRCLSGLDTLLDLPTPGPEAADWSTSEKAETGRSLLPSES